MHPARPSLYAFTLIELSIVLVIIGLIVGGVLVGRDLISAAQVRSQITQLEKLHAGVNTFRVKYDYIPGDLPAARASQLGFSTSSDCTGARAQRDGNGLIEGYTPPQIYAALMGENVLFWADLATARLADIAMPQTLNIGYTCTTSVTNNPVDHLPAGRLGDGLFLHVYTAAGHNWYMLGKIASFNSSAPQTSPSLRVAQAHSIDKKLDDGLPTSGAITTAYVGGHQQITFQSPSDTADTSSTCYNTTGPAYSLTVNNGANANCALSFRFQ